MASNAIEIRKVAGSLGAEIHGIDLAEPIRPEVAETLRRALADHLVIFFRDQVLTPEQHLEFSRVFGPICRVPYVEPMADHPDIIAVLKEADERKISTFGNAWHSDFSFLDEPPMGSILYGREIPPFGGDTLWSNQYEAFEALSEGMQKLLLGLNAMHTGKPYGVGGVSKDLRVSRSIRITRDDPNADRETPHPAVRRHPVTGRPALFVNEIYTTRFEGMTEAESRPILRFLYDHAIRPEFTCRFRWQQGSLAVWDNRCTLHYAVNDYDGSRRLLHRITVAGERPLAA